MLYRSIFLVLALAAGFGAQASVIPVLSSGPVSLGGGDFLFTYSADLSADERLDPGATNGNSCFGSPCNPAGTFFTVYDIAGLDMADTLAETLPSNWTVSVQPTGVTPGSFSGTPDNSATENVTFTYHGPDAVGPLTIGGFDVVSTFSTTMLGKFTSQSTKNTTGVSNGQTDQVIGAVEVPSVPEPSSLAWLGAGMIGMVLARKRFRTRL